MKYYDENGNFVFEMDLGDAEPVQPKEAADEKNEQPSVGITEDATELKAEHDSSTAYMPELETTSLGIGFDEPEIPISEIPYVEPNVQDELLDEHISSQEQMREEPFYTETIKHDKKVRKHGLLSKIVVSLLVISIFGGTTFGIGLVASKPLYDKFIAKSIPTVEEDLATVSDNRAAISAVQQNTVVTKDYTSIPEIVKAVEPSVVSITSTMVARSRDFFSGRVYEKDIPGSGSGIIFDENDNKIYILTNYHVIEDAKGVVVTINDIENIPASYVGGDSQTDIAVISVERTDLSASGINEVTVAKFGNSDELQVGELAIAIGNALGEGKSATSGIISALNKKLQIEDKNLTLIQTDAAINPGNSGGPLVNSRGEVIGITTAKLSEASVEGMGFAIPISNAVPIINELLNNGSVTRPALGVSVADVTKEVSEANDLPIGVYIVSVTKESSAFYAGLESGDIIIKFDGKDISTRDELVELMKNKETGDSVAVEIVRDGENLTIDVKLMESPTQQVSKTSW